MRKKEGYQGSFPQEAYPERESKNYEEKQISSSESSPKQFFEPNASIN
jgi:hypothetical protein